MKRQTRTALGFILACVGLVACGDNRDKVRPLTSEQASANAKLESLQKEASETAQSYKGMDTPSLLNKLAEQSASKMEPFNSPAYRELKRRNDVSAEALLALVHQKKNADGLLPLLLLRQLHEKEYSAVSGEERAAILTDALSTSKTFNTWGLPGFYLEDASRALIEAGQPAVPALKRMLGETRPAPVFGSQEYMLYKRYQFRVCDYALFFLKTIQSKEEVRLPEAPADRDEQIKAIAK